MKKILAIAGIVVTIFHLVYWLLTQYDWLYFLLGFGLIYILFVLPVKKWKGI